MKKINIIKFVPYFPPHKGGLESHVQERTNRRIKKGYGDVIMVTTPMGQENINNEKIYYKGKNIGYKSNGYEVILMDYFEVIPNFPFPKFRNKNFWVSFQYLKEKIKKFGKNNTIINTHTRFFMTSLIGGLFAKKNRIKWIHIEHGVDYVKLSKKITTGIARLFDQTIGRYIFRCSDGVIGISNGCKKFANKFTNKDIPVIHRGIDFGRIIKEESNDKKGNNEITIGFVGRLVNLKGVDLLIKAFSNIKEKFNNIKLEIVGDGDERKNLENLVKEKKLQNDVTFLGFQNGDFIANQFLNHVDILVNPSYQEGLPTSVLEGLLSKCVVVATNVGGTPEISNKEDLILIEKGSIEELKHGLEYAINNYKSLRGLSYESVKEHFNWDKNINKYYDFYERALNNGK